MEEIIKEYDIDLILIHKQQIKEHFTEIPNPAEFNRFNLNENIYVMEKIDS